MTEWITNARMYAVTPAVEAGWRALLEHITREAHVPLTYVAYPAPQPLEELWSRGDLGSVFMCGYPIALQLAAVTPIATFAQRCRPMRRQNCMPCLSAGTRGVRDRAAGACAR